MELEVHRTWPDRASSEMNREPGQTPGVPETDCQAEVCFDLVNVEAGREMIQRGVLRTASSSTRNRCRSRAAKVIPPTSTTSTAATGNTAWLISDVEFNRPDEVELTRVIRSGKARIKPTKSRRVHRFLMLIHRSCSWGPPCPLMWSTWAQCPHPSLCSKV